MKERKRIEALLKLLHRQKEYAFPPAGQPLEAPSKPGVYVIRDPKGRTMHVGRTVRGREGLLQRLKNHLAGKSSFMRACMPENRSKLRKGFTFQFLVVPDDRERVLLEYSATVWHCPVHLGVGAKRLKGT